MDIITASDLETLLAAHNPVDVKELNGKIMPTGGFFFRDYWSDMEVIRKALSTLAVSLGISDGPNDYIFALDEAMVNAAKHGNQGDIRKIVYMLWHYCLQSKAFLIIDEGERDFNPDEIIKGDLIRGRANAHQEITGLMVIKDNFPNHRFYSVSLDGKRRGMVLLAPVDQPSAAQISCNYIGHKILDKIY